LDSNFGSLLAVDEPACTELAEVSNHELVEPLNPHSEMPNQPGLEWEIIYWKASVAWVRRVGRASAKPTKTKLIFVEMVGFADALPTLRSLVQMVLILKENPDSDN
jgi:hypothetical protein